jgi:hypothetical protein
MPVDMSDKKKGASDHKDSIPPGRKFFIQPHAMRNTPSPQERKIRQLKEAARETPKIE